MGAWETPHSPHTAKSIADKQNAISTFEKIALLPLLPLLFLLHQAHRLGGTSSTK